MCRSVGKMIDNERKIQNISQSTLARKAGITPPTYQSLKKGSAKLSTVITTMHVLNLPPIINFVPSVKAPIDTNTSIKIRDEDEDEEEDEDSEW